MTNDLERSPAAQPAPTEVAPRPTPVTWFRPAVDVLENAEGLLLVLDLPGVSPDRIDVRAEGRTLTVSGVRSDRAVGWRRVFTLPPTTDTERIGARSENGVLYLTLPTAEAAKPRKIEVR